MTDTTIHRHAEAPLDALLSSYVVGQISRPLHALVASHLALSNRNRQFVASLEALAAENMAARIPVGDSAGNRDSRLARIFDAAEPVKPVSSCSGEQIMPPPLAAFVGQPFEDLKWRSVMPGLREVRLDDEDGYETSLLWIKSGRAMPSHTHHGIEATLVLKGSFSDQVGRFERGDIAVLDSSVDHKPHAGAEEDCICFAVSEGPVHLTGPLARIFNWIKKH